MFENCRIFEPLLPIECSVVLDASVTHIQHALPSYSLIGSFPRRKLSYDAQGGEMCHTKNSSVSIIGGENILNFKKTPKLRSPANLYFFVKPCEASF